ncbi:MAG: aldo/keto reductase, partial [Acidimicrobiia bacterium]|nr:aldo/keto reductase [Acidimicrobiia bacterium]
IHRPDRDSHISETLGALNELVDQGKVRVLGCSNFSAEQLEEAEEVSEDLGTARFVSVQNEYSLLSREVEEAVLPACERLDIAFIPYFPLASGLLTGKYRKGEAAPDGSRLAFWEPRPHQTLDDDVLDRVAKLTETAEKFGHTLLDLAISGLLARPEVASIVAGATTPSQVRANVAAAAWTMSPEEIAALDFV